MITYEMLMLRVCHECFCFAPVEMCVPKSDPKRPRLECPVKGCPGMMEEVDDDESADSD